MSVMPAGVHFAGGLRDVVMRADLGDRQSVHIGTQTDGAIAGPSLQDADDADAFMHLDPQIAQDCRDLGLGGDFLESKFGCTVKVPAHSGQRVVKICHGVSSETDWQSSQSKRPTGVKEGAVNDYFRPCFFGSTTVFRNTGPKRAGLWPPSALTTDDRLRRKLGQFSAPYLAAKTKRSACSVADHLLQLDPGVIGLKAQHIGLIGLHGAHADDDISGLRCRGVMGFQQSGGRLAKITRQQVGEMARDDIFGFQKHRMAPDAKQTGITVQWFAYIDSKGTRLPLVRRGR